MASHHNNIFALLVCIFISACMNYDYTELKETKLDDKIKEDKLTYLIFDFDGTIADTHQIAVEELNKIAPDYGLDTVSLSWSREHTMKDILDTIGVRWYQLYFLTKKLKRRMNSQIASIKPFKKIPKVLDLINKKNYVLGIMSSNSTELIESFLSNNNIDAFDFIYSGSNLFGKDKLIKKIIDHKNIRSKLVYIGDEARDIDAMKKADIPIISATWGWNSKSLLTKHGPDYMIDKPEELLDILSKI